MTIAEKMYILRRYTSKQIKLTDKALQTVQAAEIRTSMLGTGSV